MILGIKIIIICYRNYAIILQNKPHFKQDSNKNNAHHLQKIMFND